MNLIDILFLGFICWICYKIGQASIIWPVAKRIREEVEAGRLSLDDDNDEEQEPVRIERYPEGYFAYGENDRFLAQGVTFEELFTQFKDRFPSHSFKVLKNPEFTEEERQQMITVIYRIFGEEQTA